VFKQEVWLSLTGSILYQTHNNFPKASWSAFTEAHRHLSSATKSLHQH